MSTVICCGVFLRGDKMETVKRLTRRTGCVLVTLESGASIRVPAALFRAFALKAGEHVDLDAWQMKIAQAEYPAALECAAAYLARSDHSRAQVAQKLRDCGFSTGVCERTLSCLEERGFVDDARLARQLVQKKASSQGRRGISALLRAKGITGQHAQQWVEQVSDEEECAAAQALLQKKARTLQSDKREILKKAMAFLLRRGFSADSARRACRAVLEADANDIDNE